MTDDVLLDLDSTVPAPQHPDASADPRHGRWRSAFREFVVVLAGVLGALAAQAWWQRQQDHEHERAYLRQLSADTRENERRIDRAIHDDSISGQGIARVTRSLYGAGPPPHPDSLTTWFSGGAMSASDFQPLTGSYASLVSSGDLRIIRTDSLRGQIVAYAARLDSERENLQFFFAQAFSDPGRLGRALPFMRRALAESGYLTRPHILDAPTVARMREDPEVASIMFSLQIANINRLAHLRGMREHTRQLRRTLDAEADSRASP